MKTVTPQEAQLLRGIARKVEGRFQQGDKEYRLILERYGVRINWPMNIISLVFEREMLNHYNVSIRHGGVSFHLI